MFNGCFAVLSWYGICGHDSSESRNRIISSKSVAKKKIIINIFMMDGNKQQHRFLQLYSQYEKQLRKSGL